MIEMNRILIAGNWKMNKTLEESVDFLRSLNKEAWKEAVEVALFPPFLSLFSMISEKAAFSIGAQNCFYENSGAYTGEISVPMLEAIGCDYCIVGHSERRELFKETDEDISKKLKALLKSEVKPLLCVGETLKERESGNAENKIKKQLEVLSDKEGLEMTIAYEPIWAIGTGKTATELDVEAMCLFIRENLPERFKNKVRILYGGSVNPSNIEGLLSKKNIDGVLVGGASLKKEDFLTLIRAGEKYVL